VLEEIAQDQMDGYYKERRSIQKNRRKVDAMEQHREKKNQMDWPYFETQRTREEYNRRKNRGKRPKGKAKEQIHGANKEESNM
jgi:hypothetical protein